MKENKSSSLLEKLSDPNYKVNSKFLKEYYDETRGKNTKRSGFNPRDPDGRRLSSFWSPGDTIFTVTLKKSGFFLYHIFNPDTYCKENFKILKRELTLNDTMYKFAGAMILMTLIVYMPFIQPRILRAKEEYLLHQYFKKRFFEEELKFGKKQVRLNKMKETLSKIHNEYKI